MEDRNGQLMQFYYRSETLERITTALGYCLNVIFRDGRLVQIADHTGRTMQYRYENGLLTDVVHMDQGITHYDYDARGYLIKATDQAGVTYLENRYDERGRVVLQTLANGDTYQAEYREEERKNVVRSSVGKTRISYLYSREGRPLAVEYPDKTAIRYEYDERGYRTVKQDRLGHKTVWKYDDAGRVIEEQQPGGLMITYTYDQEDNLVQVSDNAGRELANEYDRQHNIWKQARRINKAGAWAVNRYDYDRQGRLLSWLDARGNETVYSYEEHGGSASLVRLPDGTEIVREYDMAGRKLAEEDACGRTEFGYNAKNFRTLVRDGEGNETRYMYDGMGRMLALYRPKAWKAQRGEYSYRYDFLDRLIDTVSPDGSHERLLRDGEGNILKRIHPNAYERNGEDGEGIRYDYDGDGNQIRIHYPDGGCERIFYDAGGNRIKHVMPEDYCADRDDGDGYCYVYDAAGNLAEVTAPDGRRQARYTYDLCGNVLEDTDALGRTAYYSYDLQQNLTQVLRPAKEKNGEVCYERTTYAYDENGNRTKEKRHGGYWSREGKWFLRKGQGCILPLRMIKETG